MRRLWRWLCCRTGHHRETVRETETRQAVVNTSMARCYIVQDSIAIRCLDCGQERTMLVGLRRTPSRRYALRGKA